MVKYIDAEKFIAYLNKKMQSYKSKMVDPRKYPIDHIDLMALLAREYQAIIANIITLQQEQPEVDLEVRKQIEELANDWHHKGFASDEDCPLCMQDLMDNLWHFYELGKNSK